VHNAAQNKRRRCVTVERYPQARPLFSRVERVFGSNRLGRHHLNGRGGGG